MAQDKELTRLTKAAVVSRRRQISLILAGTETKGPVTPAQAVEMEAAEVTCQAAHEKLIAYKWSKL